jgi:carboxymethylenebutenolidase
VPDTHFDAPAGRVRGYVAEPTTQGPHPGIVVIHELFGLTDDIRAKADRFASRGYVALAPDLFSTGPKALCVLGAFRSLTAGKGSQLDSIEAARQVLADREDCSGRVGVIGFCMGGGFALLAAPMHPFAAASVNYGQVPRNAKQVLAGACPVVASYGKKDLPLKGAAAKLERALEANGVSHDVHEYEDASHSFLNQYSGLTEKITRVIGIGHNAPAADHAWRRIDAFFDEHVKRA